MKKILYVDVDPEEFKGHEIAIGHIRREEAVLAELKKSHEVVLVYDLHSSEVDRVLERKNFDILLTHLPYNRQDFTYEGSLKRLQELIEKHKTPGLEVIVYTGADERHVANKTLQDLGVSAIVRKTLRDDYSECKKLRKALEEKIS